MVMLVLVESFKPAAVNGLHRQAGHATALDLAKPTVWKSHRNAKLDISRTFYANEIEPATRVTKC